MNKKIRLSIIGVGLGTLGVLIPLSLDKKPIINTTVPCVVDCPQPCDLVRSLDSLCEKTGNCLDDGDRKIYWEQCESQLLKLEKIRPAIVPNSRTIAATSVMLPMAFTSLGVSCPGGVCIQRFRLEDDRVLGIIETFQRGEVTIDPETQKPLDGRVVTYKPTVDNIVHNPADPQGFSVLWHPVEVDQ